jgi:predicted Zn finger-like uncharacterized protein
MIIICPQCQTKFTLDDARVPEGGGKARCSRCRQVFTVKKGTEPTPPPKGPILQGIPPSPETPAPIERPGKRAHVPRWVAVLALIAVFAGGLWVVWEKTPYLRHVETFFASLRESLGLADSSPGSVSLENLKGYYSENIGLKWVFVVEGQAVNQWNESRSFIKVKGTLLDTKARKVEEKIVYCGNILGEKDLREMTRESIQKSLSSQFGVSFSNVNIPPRKSVPFMIVFTDFVRNDPENAGGSSPSLSDFSVEVLSSKKGSK